MQDVVTKKSKLCRNCEAVAFHILCDKCWDYSMSNMDDALPVGCPNHFFRWAVFRDVDKHLY